MTLGSLLRQGVPGVLLAVSIMPAGAASASAAPSLAGTWTLAAADVEHPDGTRGRDYGADPKGMLLIDASGNYSLQIFKSERPRFASNDKRTGTPEEYREAALGSSTHYGSISMDPAAGTLTFHIRNSSFPNWVGQAQQRRYELKGNELSYRVTPRPNGDVPISVWRRVD
ncbi:lipocalin-like domain-containing protein [Burkholderia anthina]|uniref:lipocalin-like domain-containing protein n=1 Tax=Burkholderia anthina TaxID=179879 RepID=UPI0037C184DF